MRTLPRREIPRGRCRKDKGSKVLVRQRAPARGAGSGIELDMEGWAVWTLNDEGLVMRLESYLLHQEAEALEAAGLRE